VADRLRRIAVLTHFIPANTAAALRELGALRDRLGLQLLLPPDELAKHPWAADIGFEPVDDRALCAADVCLVFGGDGTILRALGRLLGCSVPTLGVNFGNVGFLASLPQDGWGDGLTQVVEGHYSIAELLTVEARLNGQRFAAVNDVVISRTKMRGVLHFEYAISGTHVGGMRCDGMIIASPTGSTAYNLSCDGPLVVWDASVLVLNFVAPHSLGFRPMVLRPDHTIEVRNASDTDEAEVMVDGHMVGILACGDTLQVGASELRARLMVREGVSFYRNVEEKLFGFGAYAH
jgi:NAD+ kinase